MYKCCECGHLFEEGEQKKISETSEYFGTIEQTTYKVCPICEGEYEVAKPCKICGCYENMLDNDEDFCEDCKTRVLKEFKRLMDANFTAEERELLNEMLEGQEL